MSKPSKELAAMREAINAYLDRVLCKGDESRDHDLQPEDAYLLSAVMACLGEDLQSQADVVSEREQDRMKALAGMLYAKQSN